LPSEPPSRRQTKPSEVSGTVHMPGTMCTPSL
jgi:hypothetical protein